MCYTALSKAKKNTEKRGVRSETWLCGILNFKLDFEYKQKY